MSLVEQQAGMTDLLPCNDSCGGDYATYSFGQTDKEVTVTIPVPSGTTSKMVRVEITRTTLSIMFRQAGQLDWQSVLHGSLFMPIKSDDSTWYLQDKSKLIIILVKGNFKYEEWWPSVVQGERQIDMKTLRPPEVRLSELDEGAQATVARLMQEQQQKANAVHDYDTVPHLTHNPNRRD